MAFLDLHLIGYLGVYVTLLNPIDAESDRFRADEREGTGSRGLVRLRKRKALHLQFFSLPETS